MHWIDWDEDEASIYKNFSSKNSKWGSLYKNTETGSFIICNLSVSLKADWCHANHLIKNCKEIEATVSKEKYLSLYSFPLFCLQLSLLPVGS